MKKIIIFANSSWYVKNFKFNLVKKLNEKYKVLLIFPDRKYKSYFDINNIENIILDKFKSHSKNIFNEIRIVWNLFLIYKKFKPSLSIHYTIKPNIYGVFLSKILKIKSLNNITGLGNTYINNNFLNRVIIKIYFFSQRYATSIIFQNSYDLEDYKKTSNIKNFNIIQSSGVDTNYFFPKKIFIKNNDNVISFLMISRIIKEKGVNEFLESSKIISTYFKNEKYKINFILIGDNYNDYLYQKLIKYSSFNYLKYIEHSDDIRGHIANSSCIVLPSYREGSSKVLIEGASMGKPILASNVPGCNNIVFDNKNGYLFNKKDVNSLVDTLIKFIKTSDKQKKIMGSHSRKIALENYDIKYINNQHLNIINNLI